ncbi:MAG: putative oxidoreductase, partial [Acidobacteriaceae bacterium]|nr:putative oxidoreductase [Acidobacteriaceae bacterium]
LIARILLGLVFVFFGLNAFFNFLHAPMPTGLAGQFTGALFASHFYVVPFGFQILGGLLMLVGRYVSLGLVILAPILVNILTFHLTMAPGILPGLVCTLLWFVVFAAHRESFRGILSANG